MTTATKTKKSVKKKVSKDLKVGFYKQTREDGEYTLEKVCSCGYSSTAIYPSFKDVPKTHVCDDCGNVNFLEENYVYNNKRTAVPIVYDVKSSNKGFDFKKTNLSIVFDKDNKKIEVIQPNLVRRYVFDWVKGRLLVSKNGVTEYNIKSESEMGYYEREQTFNRVSAHLKKGLGHNLTIIKKLGLENSEFYRALDKKLGEASVNYYSRKSAHETGFLGILREALLNKEKYNWIQVLGSAGYKNINFQSQGNYYNEPTVDASQTKPHKILKLSKKFAGYVRQSTNFNNHDLIKLQKIMQDGRRAGALISIMDSIPDKTDFTSVINCIGDLEYLILTRQYQPARLAEYVFNEIHLYQGISSPSEGVGYLRDYANMCSKMKIPFEKYPKSLKREHDVTTINYNIYAENKKSEIFADIMSENDYLKDDKLDKDFCVVLPRDPQDLVKEGGKLNHCVGSYVGRIEDGESVIAFLRNKKDKDVPLVTLEVKDWRIKQARGKSNRALNEDERVYLSKWAEARQLYFA